jgi:hypothetical protein
MKMAVLPVDPVYAHLLRQNKNFAGCTKEMMSVYFICVKSVDTSCERPYRLFCKCVCAGIFLQSATRTSRRRTNRIRTFDCHWRTTIQIKGGLRIGINTSYLDDIWKKSRTQLVTKKTYLRSVTQIREEWLKEVAPDFFSNSTIAPQLFINQCSCLVD